MASSGSPSTMAAMYLSTTARTSSRVIVPSPVREKSVAVVKQANEVVGEGGPVVHDEDLAPHRVHQPAAQGHDRVGNLLRRDGALGIIALHEWLDVLAEDAAQRVGEDPAGA